MHETDQEKLVSIYPKLEGDRWMRNVKELVEQGRCTLSIKVDVGVNKNTCALM